MPKFLEQKLMAEYGNNPHAVYGTMNTLGAMHGNKETPKGVAMQRQHDAVAKKPLHPALKAHGQKVAAAHAHLAKTPGFTQRPAAQRMRAIQAHIRRTRG